MTKKNIAIALLIFWALLIIYRLFFSEQNELNTQVVHGGRRSPIPEKINDKKTIKYPELTGYKFKRDIFADLIKDTTSKNVEKEKKPEVKPAPPLPLLPSPPEIIEEKKEVKPDELNNIVLLGIMDKKEKRFAFLKKGNDIKSFKKMDKLFDTNYIIEKISKTEIVLVDAKGERRILKLDKEGHQNEKKD